MYINVAKFDDRAALYKIIIYLINIKKKKKKYCEVLGFVFPRVPKSNRRPIESE